jgi:hypothetical protein
MGWVRLGAAAVTAAIGLLAAGFHGGSHMTPVTPFGGSTAVHIAHVGRIDVDIEPAATELLRRIRCGAARLGTACYVGR